MRVCLLTHYYEPEVGAPQRRWSAIVPELVAAGHQVTVVTTRPHYPVGRAGAGAPGTGRSRGRHGETVVRVPYVPYDRARRGRRFADQLLVAALSLVPALRARPQVVIATVPGLPTMVTGRVLAVLARARQVVDMRDAWPDLLVDAGAGPGPLVALAQRYFTRLQRRADVVTSASSRFAERLRARGVPDVVHMRNGFDVGLVEVLPPPPAVEGRPLRVLYAGTVGESQALGSAVRAVGLCPPGSVELTVVGHGATLPDLLAERAALPDPTAVVVLPPTDPAGVRRLLADSDTGLVPLRSWPGFEVTVPSKLYELMALGRHVCASLAGEAAEIVVTSGAGDVVPPEDPAALAGLWQELAADPGRLVVGEAPRRWVAEHADDAVLARRWADLVGRLAPG
ncbi:glycosyltransferase family 4 protein [Aquipuribacter sp. MA13-6]|uniref:glycosyltransferase family 4 protein n=1 Tax=unclassified Aquipuribacter TaxID=2635084 RepID=UPI003EED0A10